MKEERQISEAEYFQKINSLSHNKNCNKLAARYSYHYLNQHGLLDSAKIIEEVKNAVTSTKPYKVKLEAYRTCQRLGVECDELPKHNFSVSESESEFLAPVFQYMKKMKWLQSYNSPKFRAAFSMMYPSEYKKKIKNMSKKAMKESMFNLYRKYYMYFIIEGHLGKYEESFKDNEQLNNYY